MANPRAKSGQFEKSKKALYTPSERARRDATKWTLVQGILAPLQFIVFLISLALVVYTLRTGEGYFAATTSIVLKTLILYAIMITGSIWEKVVFDKYLFAESFFWEDVFSILVLALHTAYLIALFAGWLPPTGLLWLALGAYAAYFINATQFLLKLRAARLQAKQFPSTNLVRLDSDDNAQSDKSAHTNITEITREVTV